MSFQFKDGEKIGRGIRRVARQETKAIIEHLAGLHSENEGKSVHEARKHLKKLRALLRLIQEDLGGRAYRRENRTFRDVGRVLSPRRDVEVLVKTLEKLRRHPAQVSRPALLKLAGVLLGRHQQVFETGDREDPKPMLKVARSRAKDWSVEKVRREDLISGLRRSYRQGRKALRQAERARTNENLHEWRKRVKDLWYQLCLVCPVCPKVISELAEETKKLGADLGDDHDLGMLGLAAKGARLKPKEEASILHWIEAHRRPLQAAAFDLGRRCYAEKPDRFAQRIRDCSQKGDGR